MNFCKLLMLLTTVYGTRKPLIPIISYLNQSYFSGPTSILYPSWALEFLLASDRQIFPWDDALLLPFRGHMFCLSNLFWFDNPNNIWWGLRSLNFLISTFSAASYYFQPYGHHLWKHPQFKFFDYPDRSISTFLQKDKQNYNFVH